MVNHAIYHLPFTIKRMNRRDAIQRVAILMGGTLSAGAMLGVMNGCKADPKTMGWTPQFFSAEEGSLLEAVAERIIPKTDTPGATDAGVPTFIDTMMKGFFGEKEQTAFREGLLRVEADAKAAHGKSFVSLKPEEQDALLAKFDQEAYDQSKQENRPKDAPQPFFRSMKELTLLGFFTSEVGATEFLQYVPSPGVYQGCVPYAEIGRAWATS